jgi:hypothetical protein
MAGSRQQIEQNVLPLAVKLAREKTDPGGIAARPSKRRRQACSHHVVGGSDNGNRRGRSLCGTNGHVAAAYHRVQTGFDQLCCDARKLLVAAGEATAINGEILSFDEAEPAQLVKPGRQYARGEGEEDANSINASSRLCSELPRPCGCRAGEKRDELPPLQRIEPHVSSRVESCAGILPKKRIAVRCLWPAPDGANSSFGLALRSPVE